MNECDARDSLIGKYKHEKMSAAYRLTGCGFHETIKELYELGYKQTEITNMINKEAGKVVASSGGINNSIKKLGLLGEIPTPGAGRKISVPRVRRVEIIPTGKIRPCNQCDELFPQTNVNHARCPDCTGQGGHVAEYYKVNNHV